MAAVGRGCADGRPESLARRVARSRLSEEVSTDSATIGGGRARAGGPTVASLVLLAECADGQGETACGPNRC